MKKNTVLGTIILSSLVLGGMQTVSYAATYQDATHAKSNGKIKFVEGKPEIVDPNNPDKPVIPVDPKDPTNPNPENPPVNPNKGDLMIQYVSDFDFGVHKKTVRGMTVNAKADRVFDEITEIGPESPTRNSREVVPFVSTLDTRTDREGGWSLRVSASEFTSEDKKIKGAEVIFSNVNYASPTEKTPVVFDSATKENFLEGLKLTTNPQTIATASTASNEDQGMGSYSIALGSKLVDQTDGDEDAKTYNVSNGVTFSMPKDTSVSAVEYHATINWELVPGIK